ncbi:hypothetical protein [Streptomyces scabiei]|uniref:hypothetical protein n=1 Tax=Streptomyces scabiei TaxID=1930 RepID=UPI00131E3427|nr:hypothetical protein [Streptomyces scabiei]
MLDLSITVAGKQVYRVSKDDSARIQARYIIELAMSAGLALDPEPAHFREFIAALFYFPSHRWQSMWPRQQRWYSALDVAYDYFEEEIQRDVFKNENVDYVDYRDELDEHIVGINQLADRYIYDDHISGAANPTISLPYFFQGLKSRSVDLAFLQAIEEAKSCLKYLHGLLDRADVRASDDKHPDLAAHKFISTFFAYGSRWMTFARCTVPLGEQFIINVREKRGIYFSPSRASKPPLRDRIANSAWQLVAFADAETNHVTVEVKDTAVRLRKSPTLYDQRALKIAEHNRVDEENHTHELYSIKDTKNDPYRRYHERIWIRCPLGLVPLQSSLLYLTIATTVYAIALLLNRGASPITPSEMNPRGDIPLVSDGLSVKDATLILVPVAFAAALLLSKQDSTLSAHIRKYRHALLMISLFVLLGTAFTLLAIHHVRP